MSRTPVAIAVQVLCHLIKIGHTRTEPSARAAK